MQSEPKPIGQLPSDDPEPTSSQVKRARMLVSLLGADFAKTSEHPFFKELAHTAVVPLPKKAEPPDMSKALSNLVRRLAEAKKAKEAATPKPEVIAEEPEIAAEAEETPEILTEHPALIAKHLVQLSSDHQLTALRKLRGPTARQVAAYLSEMKR